MAVLGFRQKIKLFADDRELRLEDLGSLILEGRFMEEEKSKGESVYSFSVVLFILAIIIGGFGFVVFLCIGLETGRVEPLVISFFVCPLFVLVGKFLSDLLGCIGEIEINTKKTNKAIEAIANRQRSVDAFFEESPESDEPCFMDWLLDGLKLSQYEETFKAAGVREYGHFMKLSEEDLKKLRLEESVIKRLLNTQIKMKVTK